MKLFIISADAYRIDQVVKQCLLDFLPDRVALPMHADLIVVVVSFFPGYKFNPILLVLHDRPYVLLDFTEYGPGWDQEANNLLGTGALKNFNHLDSDEWKKLDQFVADHPPRFQFKRELLSRDVSPVLKPIEWPCMLPPEPIQTREEFDARPIDVFFCWGYSHPARPALHERILSLRENPDCCVIDQWGEMPERKTTTQTWVSINSPADKRKPIQEVMRWNGQSKISVSMPGFGVKCFRASESPINSVMAMHPDKLAWSVPWTDNCLRIKPESFFENLNWYLQDSFAFEIFSQKELYNIYIRGVNTIDRLRPQRYVNEWVMPAFRSLP